MRSLEAGSLSDRKQDRKAEQHKNCVATLDHWPCSIAADMRTSKTICGPVTFCIRFRHHSEFSAEEQGFDRRLRLTRAVSRDSKQRPKTGECTAHGHQERSRDRIMSSQMLAA